MTKCFLGCGFLAESKHVSLPTFVSTCHGISHIPDVIIGPCNGTAGARREPAELEQVQCRDFIQVSGYMNALACP
jgi:hypothetical protein